MERGEPSLVPEWYKPANGGTRLSPHSEERDSANSSKSRLSAGTRDAPTFGVHEKDSHPYSSFGRNRRDREIESRGRDRRSQVDDRVYESFSVSSRDRSRRSQSVEPGRQVERAKRPGNGARNGVAFGSGLSVIGGVSRASFERDFPSLGPGIMDSLSSPGIGAVGCLPMGSSSGILAEGWNSALVDIPAPQSPSGTPGLKMVEALVQAPSRVRTPPQLPSGSQVSEELARRQSKLLIPVTPSTPKTLTPCRTFSFTCRPLLSEDFLPSPTFYKKAMERLQTFHKWLERGPKDPLKASKSKELSKQDVRDPNNP